MDLPAVGVKNGEHRQGKSEYLAQCHQVSSRLPGCPWPWGAPNPHLGEERIFLGHKKEPGHRVVHINQEHKLAPHRKPP